MAAVPTAPQSMLALTASAVWLAVRGVRSSHQWVAQRTRRWTAVARLLPLLTPLLLLSMIHRVVGALYRGRDVAWIQVPYLSPTFILLLVTASIGGVIVFVGCLTELVKPHANRFFLRVAPPRS